VTISEETPLHLAAYQRHTEVAQVLIDNNANLVTARESLGELLFVYSIRWDIGGHRLRMSAARQECGYYFSSRYVGGNCIAIRGNQENMVELLIEKQPDVILIPDDYGNSRLATEYFPWSALPGGLYPRDAINTGRLEVYESLGKPTRPWTRERRIHFRSN
jgi:ankyrin repeat protein